MERMPTGGSVDTATGLRSVQVSTEALGAGQARHHPPTTGNQGLVSGGGVSSGGVPKQVSSSINGQSLQLSSTTAMSTVGSSKGGATTTTTTTSGGSSSSIHLNSGTLQQQQQATIIELRKQLREQFEQMEALKRQNARLSVLVDTAVVKLESLGYSLIPPFDIERELLAASNEAAVSTMRHHSSLDGDLLDGKMGGDNLRTGTQGGGGGGGVSTTMAVVGSGGGGGSNSAASSRKFRMQHELKEHRGAVTCGQFSPDGTSFCAGSYDGRCSIWRVRSERIRHPSAMLCGSEAMISDLSWYPSSDRVVTTAFDGFVKSYAVETGNIIHNFEPTDGSLMLATSTTPHHSLYICSDSRQGMHLVDIRAKNGAVESWRNNFGANLSALAVDRFSNNSGGGSGGREWIRVLSGDTSGIIALWDLRMVSAATAVVAGGGGGAPVRTPTRRSTEELPPTPTPSGVSSGQENHDQPTGGPSSSSSRYTKEITSQWYDVDGKNAIEHHPGIVNVSSGGAEGGGGRDDRTPTTLSNPPSTSSSAGVVRSPISHLSLHQHSGDDSERLLVVSEEGSLRLYQRQANYGSDPLRGGGSGGGNHNSGSGVNNNNHGGGGGINTSGGGAARNMVGRAFALRTLATGVPTRSNPIRAGYRPGNTQTRRFIDDDEEDDDEYEREGMENGGGGGGRNGGRGKGVRAISDSDLMVVGGTDHNVSVFDVSSSSNGSGGLPLLARNGGAKMRGEDSDRVLGGGGGGGGGGKSSKEGGNDGNNSSNVDDSNPLRREAQLIQRLEGHKDTVYGAVFHPDEPIIASFSADSTIRIWVPQQKKF